MSALPRTLVISDTGLGSPTATGALLANLFLNWPRSQLLVVDGAHASSRQYEAIHAPTQTGTRLPRKLMRKIRAFEPELIYYRPVDEPAPFAAMAEVLLAALGCPYVLHIMDDWPARLSHQAPATARITLPRFEQLIGQASGLLCISHAMAEAYEARYSRPFVPIANGVDREQVQPHQPWTGGPFRILYSGALADDMTQHSVHEVARAVSRAAARFPVEMTIRTMPWFRQVAERIAMLPAVSAAGLCPAKRYLASLQDADCLLIAYNFDEASLRYSRLSLANKLPEYLASGTPILAHGPLASTTIEMVSRGDLALVVSDPSPSSLDRGIETLIQDETLRRKLADQGRQAALENFDNKKIRAAFEEQLNGALMTSTPIANPPPPRQASRSYISGPFERGDKAHLDETLIVSRLVEGKPPGLMIDVGAHHGSAFRPFHRAGWTVHAFEPDANNRAYLEERYTALERFHLDPRAVSNLDDQNLAFYTSEESTGVSGLSAFTDRHQKTGDVTTVTLKAYMEAAGIDQVDFLKVDTEGFDLLVLQGFDWERCAPAIVECEFEDTKTVPLGYSYDTLATFLQDRGYTVFVSEWHPIVRYGIKHQWHSMYQYPGSLHDEKGWGNMLAFREPPSAEALQKAVGKNLGHELPRPTQAKRETSNPSFEITVSEESHSVKQPVSTSFASYPKMASRFYRSRPGVIVLAFSFIAVALAGLAGLTAAPLSYLAAATALASGLLVPAYLYTRINFEREQALAQIEANMEARISAAAKAMAAEAQLATTRLSQRLSKIDRTVTELQSELLAATGEPDAAATRDQSISDLKARLAAGETTIASTEQKLDLLTSELPATFEQLNELRSEVLRLREIHIDESQQESA